MEDSIGTLLVILMVPGLILLVAVVVGAMFHLKSSSSEDSSEASEITPVKLSDP